MIKRLWVVIGMTFLCHSSQYDCIDPILGESNTIVDAESKLSSSLLWEFLT
jgi:hypothetical protein